MKDSDRRASDRGRIAVDALLEGGAAPPRGAPLHDSQPAESPVTETSAAATSPRRATIIAATAARGGRG